MSKRSFLKPIALVAASLVVGVSHAYVPNNVDVAVKSGETNPKQAIEVASALSLSDFIITQAEPSLVMAGHSSHASHSSHSSHSSHASSSQ